MIRKAAAAIVFFLCGCGAANGLLPGGFTPNVKVHINTTGLHTEMQTGHDVEALHYDAEGFRGQKPGYFVLRREDDWLSIWKDARPDAPIRPAPPPKGVNWDKQLLLVATATSANATKVTIDRVIATENQALQVYITEEVPGDGCPAGTQKDSPIDIVIAEKPVDEVTYWVDVDRGTSCGERPHARVECKVLNAPGEPMDKITVQSGQTVVCDGSKSDAGSAKAIMDRNWYFTLAPAGSTAKLRIENGKTATFLTDAYGTYTIRLEVSDNEGRSNDGVATINVLPPEQTTVQLGWGHITAQDDPETFPRIELQVSQTGSAVACTTATDVRPAWCKMDHLAALTRVNVEPVEKKHYKFRVKYNDDRYQGGPMVCLRVFPKGQKPAEVCDDNRRKQYEVWDVGYLDLETGLFSDKEPIPKKVEASAPAPKP